MAKDLIVALLAAVGVAVVVLIVRRRRRARRSALAAKRAAGVAFGASGAEAVSVQFRVMQALAAWAGVSVGDVPPDSKKIADLWRQSLGNPQLTDGDLSALIASLVSKFPEARLKAVPADLRDGGGLATVALLIRHVERRA